MQVWWGWLPNNSNNSKKLQTITSGQLNDIVGLVVEADGRLAPPAPVQAEGNGGQREDAHAGAEAIERVDRHRRAVAQAVKLKNERNGCGGG